MCKNDVELVARLSGCRVVARLQYSHAGRTWTGVRFLHPGDVDLSALAKEKSSPSTWGEKDPWFQEVAPKEICLAPVGRPNDVHVVTL